MATLEEIIEEARRLPVEDQKRLRDALDTARSTGAPAAPVTAHPQEREWIAGHREEYLGQWVALSGNRLLAHGADARRVYLAAREAGIEAPYVERVEKSDDGFMGGWL